MIGISSPSISTNKLSIPRPEQADSRCSTVEILFSPICKTLASRVSVINSALPGTGVCSPISRRTKEIPELIGAGFKYKLERLPECKPIPTVLIGSVIVCCFNIILNLHLLLIKYVLKQLQHYLLQTYRQLQQLSASQHHFLKPSHNAVNEFLSL